MRICAASVDHFISVDLNNKAGHHDCMKKTRRIRRKLSEVKRTPNPKVIARLEKMLEQAKEGQLTSFIAVFRIDGESFNHVRIGLETLTDHMAFAGNLLGLAIDTIPRGESK
jgi:ribosomal protein L1